MTAAEMCRVSIRTAEQDVDFTLPAHVPIAELVPAVVDLIGKDDATGTDPHLIRVCGQRLDPAATLAQCAIADGELLILLSAAALPAPTPAFDVSVAVIDAVASSTGPVLVRRKQASAVMLGVSAVGLAGLTAALAVPADVGLPSFLLAMSAMSATSLLAWRLLDCAPVVFLPLAAVAMAASAATVGAVVGWWPTITAGPILALASLALLTASVRVSVRSSGLSASGLTDAEIATRARTARHRLTLLVATAAGGAILGAAVTAATTTRPTVAAGFIAIVGSTLGLRAYRKAGLCHLRPGAQRAVVLLDLAVSAAVIPSAVAAAGLFATLPGIGHP